MSVPDEETRIAAPSAVEVAPPADAYPVELVGALHALHRYIGTRLSEGYVFGEDGRAAGRDLVEIMLRERGPEVMPIFREMATQAEAAGSEALDSYLLLAEEAEKLLAASA